MRDYRFAAARKLRARGRQIELLSQHYGHLPAGMTRQYVDIAARCGLLSYRPICAKTETCLIALAVFSLLTLPSSVA
jgi:hypothetical protein